jgi:hypothetical protein
MAWWTVTGYGRRACPSGMQDVCQPLCARLDVANDRAFNFLQDKAVPISRAQPLQARHTPHQIGKKFPHFCHFAIESAPDWT